MNKLDFSELLCSRLCHDLVSPVGAISNGMEILKEEDDPEIQEQVMDMLTKSSTQTANRLQFFRLAFGASGGLNSTIDVREVHTALGKLIEDTRAELSWDVQPMDIPKSLVKTLLNLGLISTEALPRGGLLEISLQESDEGFSFEINISGERTFFQKPELAFLNGESKELELSPRTVPAHLVRNILDETGGKISVNYGDNPNVSFKVDFF